MAWGILAATRRCLSSVSTARHTVGAVFDIDGVLIRGHAPLPGARDSLLRLNAAKVPYIFLTNGGVRPDGVAPVLPLF